MVPTGKPSCSMMRNGFFLVVVGFGLIGGGLGLLHGAYPGGEVGGIDVVGEGVDGGVGEVDVVGCAG